MKKSKFLLISLVLIVLAGLGLIFGNVEAKAASDNSSLWNPPVSAKNFVDIDGKGVRVYIWRVFADEQGDFDYASLVAVRTYTFGDKMMWLAGGAFSVGSNYFEVGLADLISYYLSRYPSNESIPEADRAYLYFDVGSQKFKLEYQGLDYIGFLLGKMSGGYEQGYVVGRSEGFNEGYDLGYSRGYEEGESDGYEHGYDTGYDLGLEVGREEGYENGYSVGESDGLSRGYEQGYDNGYNDGVLATESEAYEKGFSDGQKSKLAENNEKFYSGIEKWLVPAIIAVILLGGFVTIAVRKRKEE